MSEYRVCVTSGYPFRFHTTYEAEAIVYTYGGFVSARFIRGGVDRYRPERNTEEAKRAEVRARAEAWIEAVDAA